MTDALAKQLPRPDSGISCLALGQTGIVLRSPSGTTTMIDPYLSDWAETGWGVKRVIEPPIDPGEIRPDLLLISHWHEDHLDAPIVKKWAADKKPGTFAGPISCASRALAWGWQPDRVVELQAGKSVDVEDVHVTATFARHEEEIAPAPDAIGFLLEIDGMKLWHAADTEYDIRLRSLTDIAIDVAFLPINGGANMTTDEAAFLAWKLSPKVVVPTHYDMWKPEGFGPGATLDPLEFEQFLRLFGGESEVRILKAGETTTFPT